MTAHMPQLRAIQPGEKRVVVDYRSNKLRSSSLKNPNRSYLWWKDDNGDFQFTEQVTVGTNELACVEADLTEEQKQEMIIYAVNRVMGLV